MLETGIISLLKLYSNFLKLLNDNLRKVSGLDKFIFIKSIIDISPSILLEAIAKYSLTLFSSVKLILFLKRNLTVVKHEK